MPRYGHELTDAAAHHRAALKREQADFFKYLLEVKQAVAGNKLRLENMADVAWFLKEVQKFADDIRKEAAKSEELLEKICCAMYVQQHAADPFAIGSGRIEGFVAAGSPESKIAANLPSRKTDPGRYAELMRFMGATDQTIRDDLLRIYWPHFTDLLTKRAQEGLPPPPGISQSDTYDVWRLGCLKQKPGVNVDDEET